MIAENLTKLRKQNNLTQKELSEKLNYSDKVISKWERGESTPNVEALQVLSNFYKVSIDNIVNGDALHKDETVRIDTIMLEPTRTEGPSSIAKYWIIIPLIALILLIGKGPMVFFPGLLVYSILQLIWSIQQAKVTYEATYENSKIKIVNRVRKCELYINDQIVDGIYSLIVFNPSLLGYIGEDTIKVKIDNAFSIKCRIFVNKKHI